MMTKALLVYGLAISVCFLVAYEHLMTANGHSEKVLETLDGTTTLQELYDWHFSEGGWAVTHSDGACLDA